MALNLSKQIVESVAKSAGVKKEAIQQQEPELFEALTKYVVKKYLN